MKIYVIQNKNGIMMNVSVSVKSENNGVLLKKAIHAILVNVIVSVIKHVKLVNI